MALRIIETQRCQSGSRRVSIASEVIKKMFDAFDGLSSFCIYIQARVASQGLIHLGVVSQISAKLFNQVDPWARAHNYIGWLQYLGFRDNQEPRVQYSDYRDAHVLQ